METMNINDPLVLFGFKSSALSLPLFLLPLPSLLFFNNGKGPLHGKKRCGTELPSVPTYVP